MGLAIALGLALAGPADAAALLSPDLQQRLDAHPTHRVIVTFSDRNQMSRLASLTNETLPMRALPMVGALLTSSQVRQVAQWEGVESIYFDASLKWMNYQSGEVTNGHKVHDFIGLSGKGVTIAVLDSGVDATHPDLPQGAKVVQNVKLVGDLGLAGASAWLENVPNTDTSSGHGTHVAGTVGGTGEASKNDPRRARYHDGIAPQAKLVGIGAGEGISILYALMGFDYALANRERYGIDIITNSWGSSNSVYDPNNPINKASYEAYRKGMVVAFAAGNDGPAENTLNPYAIVPWVINVGSGTKAKDLSSFSSRGVEGDFYKHVDVVAPGSSIISTRAPNTALPALGPVNDPVNPAYSVYYASMSGTSMATPFVAGAAALLLEANPTLSPDQVEEILMKTSSPMNYPYHVVGAGYIDVLAAVDLASRTEGKRAAFLGGATKWSSQGKWIIAADSYSLLDYTGNWSSVNNVGSTDGTYRKASVTKKSVPRLNLAFEGDAMQFIYPRNAQGGQADVYVDGVNRGRISFYSSTAETNGRFAITGLGKGAHRVELRGVQGNVYFDGSLTEGKLYDTTTAFTTTTTRYTGTMGPSVENLEVDEFTFEVGADVTLIQATLGWDGGVDIDFSLVDPAGNEVASGASLSNPEVLEFAVAMPGTYKYRVKGYTTVLANYTLDSTLTRAVTTTVP
ncbi:peptidase S8/S53 subtilisin kexin sedolisin [Lysobacter daejeonensis GH1-9]|uniref:Peptidase S8/S53 subtilisin kexin sedolisin n=1 Tax=Lysobacter daejeonensis GH1-9 TaxID=1385517 RepID=A0A0A0F002_9GAMM|nr:peptidase S8/S53 subtilisin kexin sedolisin [Lysobacter daejeonensis GH1-9]